MVEANVQAACPLPEYLYIIMSIHTSTRPGQQIWMSLKLVYITIVLVQIHFVIKKKQNTNYEFVSESL